MLISASGVNIHCAASLTLAKISLDSEAEYASDMVFCVKINFEAPISKSFRRLGGL